MRELLYIPVAYIASTCLDDKDMHASMIEVNEEQFEAFIIYKYFRVILEFCLINEHSFVIKD